MTKTPKQENKGPANWKPINVDKFVADTERVSKVYRSDPDRLSANPNLEEFSKDE